MSWIERVQQVMNAYESGQILGHEEKRRTTLNTKLQEYISNPNQPGLDDEIETLLWQYIPTGISVIVTGENDRYIRRPGSDPEDLSVQPWDISDLNAYFRIQFPKTQWWFSGWVPLVAPVPKSGD